MKFCWCTITVNNMDESLKFYQEIVGLTINRRFAAGPDTEISFLGNGETKIELIYNINHKMLGNVDGISLGFEVKSVDRMIELAMEKGLGYTCPCKPNPNIKYIYIKDPDGISIQFVENM